MSRQSSPSSPSDGGSPSSSRAGTPDPEDLLAYQELMSTLIPPSSLPPPPIAATAVPMGDDDEDEVMEDGGAVRPMTKAEKQNAKKKRRKERERLAREAEAEATARVKEIEKQKEDGSHLVDFRLFSSCPVKPVSLLPPSEDYPITANPRHIPWTEEHSERIRRVAAEAAVEAPDLGGPSTYHQKWTRDDQPTRALKAAATDGYPSTPDLFIGVVPRPRRPTRPPPPRTPDSSVAPAPTPKKAKKTDPTTQSIPTIPLTPMAPSPAPSTPAKRTRRGRRRSSTTHATPRFWAPPPGLGGKARGYAWGYRDSMEGRREEGKWGGYLRSK
ncbi:hypothetical protein IAT38_001896 [Cryptococcus sp. DSM 104549]